MWLAVFGFQRTCNDLSAAHLAICLKEAGKTWLTEGQGHAIDAEPLFVLNGAGFQHGLPVKKTDI